MKCRALALAALLPLVSLAACSSDDDSTGPTNTTTTVRFVNASGTAFDVATNGTVGAGNGNVGFGGSSSCISSSTSTTYAIRQVGSSTGISGFTPNFLTGGTYTVIAYPGVGGVTQFTTIGGAYVPASGQSGLRVFNAAAAANPYDVYVTAPGAALGTASASGVGFGNTSAFFNVAPGSQQVRFTNAGTTTVGVDAGNNSFTAGQSSTLVVAPPATGSATPRTFYVAGC